MEECVSVYGGNGGERDLVAGFFFLFPLSNHSTLLIHAFQLSIATVRLAGRVQLA